MKLTRWKVRNMIIELPSSWNKQRVLQFVNSDIKVCCQCGRVDISFDHYSNCNPIKEQQRQNSIYYKD